MDTQLLQYRLKSARRKKRLQIEDRDKQLLQLDKERKRIQKDPDYKKEVQLDEPYQKGWKRLFVLKPDIQKSEKAEFYQQVLNLINTVQYHYDESFKKPKRKGRWHKYSHDLPELKAISPYDWRMNKVILSEAQRNCFNKVHYWDDTHHGWNHKYVFLFPELFKIVVRPHIVTTIKIGDVLMEQRLSFIDDVMDKAGGQYRLWKLKGGSYKYWRSRYKCEKLKYVSPLKNVPLHLAEDFA